MLYFVTISLYLFKEYETFPCGRKCFNNILIPKGQVG